jgi:hypothetical protein
MADDANSLFDVFRDGDGLIQSLRRRIEYMGTSFGVVDELSELGEGACSKYLTALQAKAITVNSLLRLTSALGLRVELHVDEALTRKMQPLWTKRDGSKAHARRPPSLGKATWKRVMGPVAAEMGRRGAAARMARTTPEQRREQGRRGALKRWGCRTPTSPHQSQ